MFIDDVVLAGIAVVVLTFGFTGGIGYFIWKDAQRHKQG